MAITLQIFVVRMPDGSHRAVPGIHEGPGEVVETIEMNFVYPLEGQMRSQLHVEHMREQYAVPLTALLNAGIRLGHAGAEIIPYLP